jgi:hypothetical protein
MSVFGFQLCLFWAERCTIRYEARQQAGRGYRFLRRFYTVWTQGSRSFVVFNGNGLRKQCCRDG